MNKDTNILEELRELSPMLLKLKEEGHQPFQIPDGYFEGLKSDVFTYIESGLAAEAISNAFSVPDNYFENLTDDIMKSIEVEETEEDAVERGRVINLHQARKREAIPIRRWTVMAASVALFILMGVIATRFITGNNIATPEIATVSVDDAYQYLEENMMSLDNDDLFAMVDFQEEDFSLDVTDEMEEELRQYLEENIDEIDDYLLTVEI